jgi:hypothetical protein
MIRIKWDIGALEVCTGELLLVTQTRRSQS